MTSVEITVRHRAKSYGGTGMTDSNGRNFLQELADTAEEATEHAFGIIPASPSFGVRLRSSLDLEVVIEVDYSTQPSDDDKKRVADVFRALKKKIRYSRNLRQGVTVALTLKEVQTTTTVVFGGL